MLEFARQFGVHNIAVFNFEPNPLPSDFDNTLPVYANPNKKIQQGSIEEDAHVRAERLKVNYVSVLHYKTKNNNEVKLVALVDASQYGLPISHRK